MSPNACTTCSAVMGTFGARCQCSPIAQPQSSWFGLLSYTPIFTPSIKLSDEDIDKIAQAVLDKLVKGLGL